ncbi:MAG: sulfite exporter TauE/SafE family protein [Pseudomonadota bacterium]
MPDLGLLALTLAAFLAAGIVKGIVGFGLPTVALSVLAATAGFKTAVALVVLPALLTNIWQAVSGGYLTPLLKRLGPMLITIAIGVFAGTALLAVVPGPPLAMLLGTLLILYAAFGLFEITPPPVGRHEAWFGPLLGGFNGIITGLTGTFIMPGLIYLEALRLERAQMRQAMGILFAFSTAVLGLGLTRVALLDQPLAIISAAAVLPAFLGIVIGQRISDRLSNRAFRKAFFIGLIGVAVVLVVRNAGALGGAT